MKLNFYEDKAFKLIKELGYTMHDIQDGATSFSDKYGRFVLCPLYGEYPIMESCEVTIHPEFRGQGHGKRQHLNRKMIAKAAGAEMLIACVRNDNAPEIAILNGFGWQRISTVNETHSLWSRRL
jgi:ribosomal protein S18 acetylase RimI-like enzyme